MPLVALAAVAVVAAACTVEQAPLTRGVSAAEHAAWYPINVDDIHALGKASPDGQPLSCTGCHAGTATFATSVCFDCHNLYATPIDPVLFPPRATLIEIHGEVASFRAADASCLACHPDGLRGDAQNVPAPPDGGVGADHNVDNFPIGPGAAHGSDATGPYVARLAVTPGDDTTCTACHANNEDRTQQLCLACHLLDDAPQVGGLNIDDAHGPSAPASFAQQLRTSYDLVRGNTGGDAGGCKECHAETPINAAVRSPATGQPGIIGGTHALAVGIETNHNEAKCKQCHQSYLTAPKTWAIDFLTSSCTCCHVATCTGAVQDDCSGQGVVRPPTCNPDGTPR